jgi:autotransporter-associated beta strand protein/T5SS/PEP-CTERM-associated repeat protein
MRSYRRRSQATRAAALAARCAAIHYTAMPTSLLPARPGLRAVLLASVWIGAFAALTPSSAQTIDGTWLGGGVPVINEWTQGNNWSSNPDVPDRTATFTDNSAPTLVTISSTSIGTIQFTAAAPAYFFAVNLAIFEINGAGIVNNSASAPSFTNNGAITFTNASSAGNSSIATNGGFLLSFTDTSTAGSAIITTNNGALTQFGTNSNGGTARFITNAGGTVDFSGTSGPSGNNQITAGSIEGAGTYFLGSNQLTVGSNNLSTAVSGEIQDGGTFGGTGASLVKVGTGTLTLSGNNTYTGATTINAGTLAAASNTALPGQTALAVNLGATLVIADGVAAQIGSLADGASGGGGVQIGASDPTTLLTIAGNSSTTFSGAFSGPGSLELDSGSLTLTGASNGGNIGTIGGDLSLCNCDDGGLTISGGALTVNGFSQGVTVTGGTLAVINGGTLQVGNPPATHDLLVTSNMIVSGAGSTVTVSGFTGVGIFGPGSLTISNGGVLNSQSGAEIDIFDPSLGTPTATVTGPGSTWNVGGSGLTVGGGRTGGPGALIIANGGVINSTTSTTIGDAANGSSSVVVTGAGSVFNAFNSLAIGGPGCGCGPLVGTLTVADGGVVNSPGSTSIAAGSTLNLGTGGLAGAIVTPAIANDGQIAANFTDTLTLAAAVSGAGALSKAGSGTLILTGSNSYTGGTTITGGTLQLGNGGASGSIAGNVANNGTFAINRSDTFTFGGVISGTGAFAQIGPGTTILTAANTHSGGTAINSGVLAVADDPNLGAASGGLSFSGGTLQFLSGFTTNRAVTLNAGGGTFDTNGNSPTLGGTISGSGAFTKIGSGTLTLSGSSSYAGGTAINAGTLQAGAANAFAPGSAFTVASGATLNLAGFNQTIGSLAGAGSVMLGSATLTTGTDNTSTTFSGTISGTGGLTKISSGTLTLSGANTYSGGTTLAAGTLRLASNQALGTGALTTAGSVVDYANGVTITNPIVLNSNTTQLQVTAGTATQAGVISELNGPRPLEKIGGGTLVLTANNTYSGPTTISAGTLIVNGSIANSAVTVNPGATLAGTGAVGAITVTSGATFAPGAAVTSGAMTVAGNLAFQSGALYLVQVNPSTASSTTVTAGGAAALAGTVQAVFASGRYTTRSYTILSAAGGRSGTFSSLTTSNLPTGFTASLGYTATDAILNLTATLGRGPSDLGTGGLSINQSNVAEALNGFFNNGGALPPEFVSIFGLSGANLANALTLLSGEAATGGQQVAFQLTNQFLGIMLDPFVDGRSGVAGTVGPALGFAPEREELPEDIALAYAKLLKAPPKPPTFEQRWSVWGAGYGGSNRTSGDPAVAGSHDLSARTAGGAAGLDYRLAPNTVVGFALAGGGTNWSLAQGLGGGRSDAFQAGVYGTTRYGPAYVAAAFAYTNHWMSTDRFAFAGDHLTASFNAQSFGGRVEGGYRFMTVYGGLTPYAAIQAQSFRTASYSETDLNAGGFALAFNSRNATDTRSELGARFDRLLLLNPNAALTMRARVAWAHDWVSDPTLAAVFQTLPGASFIVNGAAPAKNSALTSAGAELRLANGVTLIGKFDGEFASHSSTYAGTGTVRYTW